MDGNIGEDAGVAHLDLHNLALMLQIDGDRLVVDGGIGRRCDLFHGVALQRQQLRGCQTILIALDRIHQAIGLVIDLKHSTLQRCAGGEPVDGVIVGGLFPNLDLAHDRRILPSNLRGLAGFDVEGLELGIRNVALILHLTHIDLAGEIQAVQVNVTVLVGRHLVDGCLAAVIDQETHAIDALASDAVDLVDHKPGKCLVCHCEGSGLVVLNSEIMGGAVDLKALRRRDLHTVVITGIQRDMNSALIAGGHGELPPVK